VRAFNDANGDGVFVAGDALVQGAVFTIADNTGKTIASYTSDGQSEPHCFTRLQPGTYSISIDPAPDTTAISDRHWGVALDTGTKINVNFGSQQASPTAKSTDSTPDGSGGTIGLVLIAGAIGVVGWLVYRKRQGPGTSHL
jgi:hypothetical protein